MSGGNRRIVLNTNERVYSTDHNRHQAVGARDRAELQRFLHNALPLSFDLNGSGILLNGITTSVDTPLLADIYEGLCVLPQPGTVSLFITPGVIGMCDPDGQAGSSDPNPPSADDSAYKVVSDAGIQALGSLVVAANAGPGGRIDIVEVQRRETVIETGPRDIFDPAIGSFGSVVVPKVSEGQLTYRVRQGVAGDGFPGTVQGWLPLAVILVPAGSVSTDTCTFWDVRPYVKDRSRPGRMFLSNSPGATRSQLYGDQYSTAGKTKVGGRVLIEEYAGLAEYQVGGRLARGVPGTDEFFVDIRHADHQDQTFAPGDDFWYLWLCFPYGLPRWVRYNATPIGGIRRPWGSHGIPVVSSVAPLNHMSNSYSNDIFLPLSTELDPFQVTPVTNAICIAAGMNVAGVPNGFVQNDEWVYPVALPPSLAPSAHSLTSDTYTLVAGTHFPKHAKSVLVVAGSEVTTAAAVQADIVAKLLHNATASETATLYQRKHALVPVGGVAKEKFTFEIVRTPYDSISGVIAANLNFKLYWNLAAGPGKANEACQVIAWRV